MFLHASAYEYVSLLNVIFISFDDYFLKIYRGSQDFLFISVEVHGIDTVKKKRGESRLQKVLIIH